MTLVLELQGVSKTFGGLRAVSGVTLGVATGAIFGLIGPNGAGKTTLFNLITGIYGPDPGGVIRLMGTAIAGVAPSRIAGMGVARTFQNVRLFAELTVLENVLVACENHRRSGLLSAIARLPSFYRDEAALEEQALDLLRIFELNGVAHQPSRSLSYGDQRRLEIARAMMLKPRLLLLDEPAAGLNSSEADGLKHQIRWLRDEFKLAVVLVEHNMEVVMGVCEVIHVLDHGETIAHGTPERIQRHPKVLGAYLGEVYEGPSVPPPPDESTAPQTDPQTGNAP